MSKNYIKTDVPQVKINLFNLDLMYIRNDINAKCSMAYKLVNDTKSFRHGTSRKIDIAIHGSVTDPQNDRIGWGLGDNITDIYPKRKDKDQRWREHNRYGLLVKSSMVNNTSVIFI